MLPACVSLQQSAAPATRLLNAEWVEDEQQSLQSFVGLELEEALRGTLEEMEFLSGLRVVRVVQGSPAESAGLKRGDIVHSADGVELAGLDQWEAALQSAADQVALEIERDEGLHPLTVSVVRRGSGALPPAHAWIDRFKLRAVLRTKIVDGKPVAEIVRLVDRSPLADHGVSAGAYVTGLEGAALHGAQHLVQHIQSLDYGDDVVLEILQNQESREVDLTLWEPERQVTAFSFPILFHYKSDPPNDTVKSSFLDLWLFALFAYERQGLTRRYSILRFIKFETRVGELTEVTEGG
jgi:hypothetical protein